MEALLEQHVDQRTNYNQTLPMDYKSLKSREFCSKQQILQKNNQRTLRHLILICMSAREKAFWQISPRLDEFIAMEDYVDKENEILKHHETRAIRSN